jgi:hypothetical protein
VIEPGPIYRSTEEHSSFRIRVIHVSATSVRAVEAANGRPLDRRIPNRQLHDSPITPAGRRRTGGYVLEEGQ